MPPMTGRIIAGRYSLQHPIGRGAMGVVWRARDQLLDRDVAVKEVVISALIGPDERRNAYQRTLREARTAARLSHRGVVAVYDVAEEDGRPWIVMELVPSQSLDQVLTVEGRLPAARACRIGQQLLSALAAAHAAGVLHRDVKPSNVLIAASKVGDGWEERAVLTDFGIAQFEGDPRLTQTGMVMGSPGFTAPERIRGGDAAPASDLWSLGATIYAAVEGRGPYEQRGGAITTMSAIINEDAPTAPHARQLAPLIAALLRRDPSSRPSAAAAARMFAQVLPQLTDVTEAPATPHPATVRSAYMPAPAAPVASAAVAAPEGSTSGETPAPAAGDKPAAAAPAAEVLAAEAVAAAEPAREAPEPRSSGESDEAVPDLGAEAESADVAEPEPAAGAAAGSEPAAESQPAAESRPAAESEPAVQAEPEAAAEPVPEAEPAAETGAPTVPAPQFAEVQAPEVVADAAAAEPKAAATLLDARPAAEAAHGAAGETVIADDGPAGYQPTELSIPVARVPPSAPAPARPVQPKPTFTAAKPTDRAKPTFTAASPARPAGPARPARPVTPPEQRPAYASGGAGKGFPSGETTPFPQSGTVYPGPSQPQPDPARQYPPGKGGGRGRRRLRRIAVLAAAVVIAAAIGVGVALALSRHHGGSAGAAGGSAAVVDTPTNFQSVNALNDPSTALPAGWWTATVTAAAAGSPAVAGFTVDLPPGWNETRMGLATDFKGPNGMLLEVDLTPQNTTNMLAAAENIEQESVASHKFPGYKRQNLQAVPVRGTEGAIWKFDWTPAGSPELVADDILFDKATSAGSQDYAVYIRSPASEFGGTALPLFDKILRTFQTVPAS